MHTRVDMKNEALSRPRTAMVISFLDYSRPVQNSLSPPFFPSLPFPSPTSSYAGSFRDTPSLPTNLSHWRLRCSSGSVNSRSEKATGSPSRCFRIGRDK